MKLSYAVYAGTTDNVGSTEDWEITESLMTSAGYQIERIEACDGIYEPNAMIAWDDDNVFLIFRGTEPTAWKQWATDANFIKKPFCIGSIHRGLANTVDLIWPGIMNCLRNEYVGKNKRLFLGGHSLGAGMSQVAASRLEFEESLHPAAIYNFGCPRALNSDGANLYNQRLGSRTYRVVNNNDVVCNLPLESMGFSHVGQFKYISADGKLHDDPGYWWLLLDGVWGAAKNISELRILDAVVDHLPENYTGQLEKLVNQ